MRTVSPSGQDLPQFEAVALIEEERRPEPNLVREESGDPGDDKSFPLEEARRLAQAILRLDGLTGAASVSGKVVMNTDGTGRMWWGCSEGLSRSTLNFCFKFVRVVLSTWYATPNFFIASP